MRLTLAALALLASIATASANVTCSWVGRYYVCNDYGSGGGQTTCSWVGRYWVCN